MTCTRCGQPIIKGEKWYASLTVAGIRTGQHHAQCPATQLVYGGSLCLPWKAIRSIAKRWIVVDAHGNRVAVADHGTESYPKEIAETIAAFVNTHTETWLMPFKRPGRTT